MEFRLIDPDEISEQAKKYLIDAIASTRIDLFDIDDYLDAARRKKSMIFGAFDEELTGCFTVEIKAAKDKKVLMVSILGGKDLKLWRDNLVAFLFDIASRNKCTDFSIIGRKGFEKMFPEVKLDACIYSVKLI